MADPECLSRLYGIDRVVKEMLDGQVLLEPLEEQFYLPAVFVDRGNRQCRHFVKVGEKYQMLASPQCQHSCRIHFST